SSWIKLDRGQHINLVAVGEPEVFEKTFERDGEKRVTKRWSIDVSIPAEKVLKTWEMSKTPFNDRKRQWTIRGAGFSNAASRLERQGSGMNTKYSLDFIRTLEGAEIDERNVALVKGGTKLEEAPF